MNINSPNSKTLMPGKSMNAIARLLKISASAAAILGSVLLAAPLLSHNVLATDMGTGATQNQGHHVRIGLGKSVVIHLPAEAKDVIVGDNLIREPLGIWLKCMVILDFLRAGELRDNTGIALLQIPEVVDVPI